MNIPAASTSQSRSALRSITSLEKLSANIEEVKPTIMVVVPRLFEMLRAKIMKQVEKDGGLPAYLMSRALSIETKRYDGKSVPWDLPMDGILSLTLRRRCGAGSAGG